MNNLIQEQLKKCKVANIPYFDDSTVKLTIPKGSALTITVNELHKCYLLQLADWIIHPSPDSTLACNWNGGVVPKSQFYQAEISQVLSKMIRITGCGFDPETNTSTGDIWEGWVPQEGIKIIKELL